MNEEEKAVLMEIIQNILSDTKENKTAAPYITPELMPNIDLYMDQVTTFMDTHLASSKRYEEDKILTKTMINNYTKNNLLPPPDKKKYSKDHLLLLTFIYYFKGIISMNDIKTLLSPLADTYFKTTEQKPLTDIYTEVLNMNKSQINDIMKDIESKFDLSKHTFKDYELSEKDALNAFAFISSLICDIYIKKQLVEQVIDQIGAIGQDNKADKKLKKQL